MFISIVLDIEVIKPSTENVLNTPTTREIPEVKKDDMTTNSKNITVPAISPPLINMKDTSISKSNIESSTVKETDCKPLKVTELDTKNKNMKDTIVDENAADMKKSYETINFSGELEALGEADKTDSTIPPNLQLHKNIKSQITLDSENLKRESLETASTSSWMSIDDDIKVKKVKDEQVIKDDAAARPNSGWSINNLFQCL